MRRTGLAVLCAAALSASPAMATCPASSDVATAPMAPLKLWPKGAPDLKGWPGFSSTPVRETALEDGRYLFNVTDPAMIAYLPAPGCATGAAVIIAPGGGFRFLSMISEGTDVARWLAAHGIAAFVLKYRLVQSVDVQMKRPASLTTPDEILGQPGVADGIQAIKLLRIDAARYGIDPRRIGAIGFSAGGHVVSMMALETQGEDRPAFVAPIYGGPFTQAPVPLPRPAPGALPPFFLAFAQDDRLAGTAVRSFYDQLFQAGYRPEVHFYARGGHGFGMKASDNSSAHFLQEFYWWMQTIGMLGPDGAAAGRP